MILDYYLLALRLRTCQLECVDQERCKMWSKQQYVKEGLSPSICINCLDFSLREGKEGINPGGFTICKMICWMFYINYLI